MPEITLTPTQAELLFAIWKLETMEPPPSHITEASLAKELKKKERNVRRIIADIRKSSKQFLLQESFYPPKKAGEKKRRGRPHVAYRLNHDHVVTYPETALMLLRLEIFPQDKAFRIRRKDFEEEFAKETGLELGFIKRRIDVNAEYIKSDTDGNIFPSHEILARERTFLELLAAEFIPPNSPNHPDKK